MTKGRLLTWLGSALIIGGAALLGSCFWTLHEGAVVQQRAREWLSRARAMPQIAAVAPARRGDVVGELEIPRLHLSVMVFEGDDPEILQEGAGHIPGTALPEGSGNIGIAAHRDSYFRALRLIHPKDLITIRTVSGISQYAVIGTEIVKPADVGVLTPAPKHDLTLVTCYPFSFVGSAPERFIVHAQRIS